MDRTLCMLVSFWLVPCFGVEVALGESYKHDPSQSVFAVVTHKAGIAKAAAHNHLIYAQNPSVSITVKPNLRESSFTFSTQVQDLLVDDLKMQKRWDGQIRSLGIETGFSEIDEDDRNDIRNSMLSEEQLDAKKFPMITAKVKSLTPQEGKIGQISANHLADLEITIRGKTVSRMVPCQVQVQGKTLTASAAGQFKFTEFGIEPFSALFGAIGNQDLFDVAVVLKASR